MHGVLIVKYFESFVNNIKITDENSILFMGPLADNGYDFSIILSTYSDLDIFFLMHNKFVTGLNVFFYANSREVPNPHYGESYPEYYSGILGSAKPDTKSKTIKNSSFIYSPILLNSDVDAELKKMQAAIKSRDNRGKYKPMSKQLEVFNSKGELIFTNGLFPIKIRDVIHRKKPFNLYSSNPYKEQLRFDFDFYPMIIPIKLPRRNRTEPLHDTFERVDTFTEFTIQDKSVMFNLWRGKKEFKVRWKKIDREKSKAKTLESGYSYVDVTRIVTDNVIQEDLYVLIAECPKHLIINNPQWIEVSNEYSGSYFRRNLGLVYPI